MKTAMRVLALFLSALLALPPALLAATEGPEAAPAVTESQTVPAPELQVAVLKNLSKFNLFEATRSFAEMKKPTEGDVTDALIAAYPIVRTIDASVLKQDPAGPTAGDWAALLGLVREKKEALRARGVSAWTYEKKLEKIVAALPGEPAAPSAAAPVAPAPAGASLEQLEAVRAKLDARLAEISSRMESLQARLDERSAETASGMESVRKDLELRSRDTEALKKSLDAERADRVAERADRVAERESLREEIRLVKSLVESLKADLADTDKRLEAVGQEAQAKTMTDSELRQSLTILRKDLRDNAQDVSVMKQKIEKLMAPEKQYARPLDKALASKWIPGAALLLSIGAVVLVASRK